MKKSKEQLKIEEALQEAFATIGKVAVIMFVMWAVYAIGWLK